MSLFGKRVWPGKALIPFALLSSIWCVPAQLSASTFKSARLEVGESEVTLHLQANGPIGTASVRSEPGQIRVWFEGLVDDARLDPPVGNSGLRFIRIRPGVGRSMVVLLRVADRRTVDPSLVQVLSDGTRAFVRIPLDALPAVRAESSAEPAPEAEATIDPGSAAEAAAEADLPEPTESPAEEASAVEEDKEEEPAVSPGLPTKDTRAGASRGASMTWLLLLVTGLLAAAYGVLRLVLKNRKKSPLDDIQIVAQKRLGTRHQIVLVRALGEDHLLSVNGQQTQRIASTTSVTPEEDDALDPSVLNAGLIGTILGSGSGVDEEAVEPLSPSVPPESPVESPKTILPAPAQAAELLAAKAGTTPATRRFDRLQQRRSGRPPAPVASQADRGADSVNRFGSELFRMALENEKRPPITVRPPKGRANESEAVAGLLKLRERLAAS